MGGEAFGFTGRPPEALHHQATFVNLTLYHRVLPHEGDRCSVVAFCNPDVPPELLGKNEFRAPLLKLGFRPSLDALPSRQAPQRVMISEDLLGNPDVVYIGKGHIGLDLPKSKWATPFPTEPGNDRKRALKRFRVYLGDSKPFQNDLEELGGKLLACHCPLHLGCHGDVIIEAYKDAFLLDTAAPPEDRHVEDARKKGE